MRKKTQSEACREAAAANAELVSTYAGTQIKIQYRCLLCSSLFMGIPNDIRRGHGCPKCGRDRLSEKQRKTTTQAQNEALKVNLELISDYEGANKRHEYKCLKCGFRFQVKHANIQQGRSCRRCANTNKLRFKDPICRKIARILRNRFSAALHGNYKAGSAVRDLGMPIPEFRTYIESLWEPWMNWDNHGNYDRKRKTWQIDHTASFTKFDLKEREQVLQVCNYTNLKPMRAVDNLKKGSA